MKRVLCVIYLSLLTSAYLHAEPAHKADSPIYEVGGVSEHERNQEAFELILEGKIEEATEKVESLRDVNPHNRVLEILPTFIEAVALAKVGAEDEHKTR